MKKLTDKQKLVIKYIKKVQKEHGFSPTYRDIAYYFDMTPKSAFDYDQALIKKGYAKKTENKSRSIILLDKKGG